MNAFVRGLLILALAAGVLGFGAAGLCGGYFTVAFGSELFSAHGGGGLALLALSLPSLLGGFYVAWVCIRQIGRTLKPSPREDKTHER